MAGRIHAARRFTDYHDDPVKRVIENATAAGEQTTWRVENSYSRAAEATLEFQQKLLAITHANVNSAFECARELVGVTSPSEFIAVSAKHAGQQFQAMTQQTRELAELIQKAAVESMGPFGNRMGGAVLGRPDLS